MQSAPNVPATLVAHLGQLAVHRAGDTALITIDAAGDTRYDYASLDARVRALASHLASRAAPGDRAMLLLDSGIDYMTAFFACLYAGLIAVPAFEPGAVRLAQVARLRAIASDADPALLLTSTAQATAHHDALAAIAPRAAVILADDPQPPARHDWHPYPAGPDTLAFLQYTSGSTASPKGVMVSHGNVIANEVAIATGMGVRPGDTMVSWLPLYHDMGLIGGLLQPIHSGVPVAMMSPQFFLERPARWLQAISRHRGTLSGGPDFAYRLCVERVRDSHFEGLDLSSWDVAFSGAEPVRADTLRAFVDRFAPAGFRKQALYPCYGLAEATLFATGGKRGTGMLSERFDPAALAQGLGKTANATDSGMELVACGFPRADHTVRIADRDGRAVADGHVGEIEIAGPSVAHGYWRNASATAATFTGDAGAERRLRTGDLGLMRDGQLYIAGRRKDLIIVRGQNLYPQDIEQAVEAKVTAARRGRVAAFPVQGPNGEAIGIAVEISRPDQKRIGHVALVQALAEAVGNACGETLAVALLLNPGGLPKTTSGKLQRSACRQGCACRQGWLDDGLDACAVWSHGAFSRGGISANGQAPAAGEPPRGEAEIALAALWQELLGAAPADRQAHFFAAGGSSLTAARLVARLRERFGAAVPMRLPFEHPTLAACAAALESLQVGGNDGADAPIARAPRTGEMPLAPAQQRMWLTDRIAAPADRWIYNMAGGLRLAGPLDAQAMRASLNALVERHEILRTSYPADANGAPSARIASALTIDLPYHDLSSLDASQRAAALHELAEAQAREPFDLSSAPLLRARLVRLADDDHALLLTLHHIVGDGWSIDILLDTLAAGYNAAIAGTALDLPPLPIQYADYAVHQHGADGARSQPSEASFWRDALQGAPRLTTIPSPNRRPPVASTTGAACHSELPDALLARVDALARAHGATRYGAAGSLPRAAAQAGRCRRPVGRHRRGRPHAARAGGTDRLLRQRAAAARAAPCHADVRCPAGPVARCHAGRFRSSGPSLRAHCRSGRRAARARVAPAGPDAVRAAEHACRRVPVRGPACRTPADACPRRQVRPRRVPRPPRRWPARRMGLRDGPVPARHRAPHCRCLRRRAGPGRVEPRPSVVRPRCAGRPLRTRYRYARHDFQPDFQSRQARQARQAQQTRQGRRAPENGGRSGSGRAARADVVPVAGPDLPHRDRTDHAGPGPRGMGAGPSAGHRGHAVPPRRHPAARLRPAHAAGVRTVRGIDRAGALWVVWRSAEEGRRPQHVSLHAVSGARDDPVPQ
ncbi:non ribosomal peptide synthase [Cupriavidus basilensis OR16]|uniref:Non ribosomal peptide synthase n=1 Tax=Cupriavidus basilensis OR16 TaxID=1127483 RepID=H1SAZ5_9BURK|nr:non ribosomal peptide synthase [Cupriavidus basilensis OR16]